MGWLDALERRGREAIGAAPLPTVKPRPPATSQSKPELMMVWVQTRAPFSSDPGGCEAGYYSVADGVVTMRDENGKAVGKSRALGPGDDARQIAGRLTREAWLSRIGESNFNRRIEYTKWGAA